MKKFLLVFAAILLLAGGCVKQRPITVDQSTPAPIENTVEVEQAPDMSAWSSYTSGKLGISFKHPKDYTVVEDPKKFPENTPPGTALVVQAVIAADLGTYPVTIYISKDQLSLKNEVAKQFNWHLVSVEGPLFYSPQASQAP